MTIERTNLLDVLNIQDPLYGDNFELYFPTLPSGITGTKDSKGLRVQCKSASIPGISNEAQDLTIHGFKINAAGRTVFPGTLSVMFIETRTLNIQRTLKNWVNAVRDFRTQKSVGRANYATKGQFIVYDETGAPAGTIYLWNTFCAEVQDVNMDGSSANITEISATFRYDFADEQDSSTGSSQF
jgi:hypothetical protein